MWSDKQRKWFLLNLFSRMRPSQICYMEEVFNAFGIYERKDFTSILPTNLSQKIFSFLSPQDLSRVAQVSSHWKYLSEKVNLLFCIFLIFESFKLVYYRMKFGSLNA